MSLISLNMQMSEVVEEYPSLIPVLNRLGIRLGLGDKSVDTICKEYGIDSDFFLTVINTFLNEDYFPQKLMQSFHISKIVDYLSETYRYYEKYQLPNIERHLNSLITLGESSNQSLESIRQFYYAFKLKLMKRIADDIQYLFPFCDSLNQKKHLELQLADVSTYLIRDEDTIEAMLGDIISLLVKHLSGDYNENLCYAVIFALHSLKKDIRQHDRIRTKILLPLVESSRQEL